MNNKAQMMKQTNRVYDTLFFVEEKSVIADANGIQKETWKRKCKLFADGKNIYGKEYDLAKQYGNAKTIKLIIKYVPFLTEEMRICFQGKIYDIDNIDNINFKNGEMEIRAIERRFDK